MDYTWGDMLVAVLERKVIDPDAPNYPAPHLNVSDARRLFRANNGDGVYVMGVRSNTQYSKWTVQVYPAQVEGKPQHEPYALRVTKVEQDGFQQYQVVDADNDDMPISPDGAEALLGVIATMKPEMETTYTVRDPSQ
jgi:hypothetical protein